MQAAIDVGSNTIRMLIGTCHNQQVQPLAYHRRMTRLGGGFSADRGIAPDAIERTLDVLRDFSQILQEQPVTRVRAVGTAVLRQAVNRRSFLDRIRTEAQLALEIIDGDEEALLSARGVLSVIRPVPAAALIVDIGGGSTELIFVRSGQIPVHRSYPVGVVRLCEDFHTERDRQPIIDQMLDDFQRSPAGPGIVCSANNLQLIGTAGTVTTLAAMQQKMENYDWRRINNAHLSLPWLRDIHAQLSSLSPQEREEVVGMETGRGDLILPGLQVLLSLMARFSRESLKISDFGLLEGVLLQLGDD